MRSKSFLSFILFLTMIAQPGNGFLFAQQNDSNNEIQSLNESIKDKQKNIDQINERIKEYEQKIEIKQAEKASLAAQLNILDNRVAKTKLEMEETENRIGLVNTEIALLDEQLTELETSIEGDKQLLIKILQSIQSKDQDLPLRLFFASDSLSQIFDEIQSLETINKNLKSTLEKTKATKDIAIKKRDAQKAKRDQMEELRFSLENEQEQLEEEMGSQKLLITQTQNSEKAFQMFLQELKEEEQYITQQISVLQKEIEGKLRESDLSGETSLLSWPFDPTKGISVYFHDPTYPYRNLFEHSGIDLPAQKGTPVASAASGYVAWARKGRLYGNYVMIVHANGLSTLYAHLSRIDVEPDEFVPRGKVIGAVGSTGLSTGPHLHFEIRKDGIPTDPLPYLSSN